MEQKPRDSQRIDQWLVFARFAKTRSVAGALLKSGHVRLNGQRLNARDKALKIGDILTLALPHRTLAVEVLAFSERRGSAPEAQRLYVEKS